MEFCGMKQKLYNFCISSKWIKSVTFLKNKHLIEVMVSLNERSVQEL